MAGEDYKVTLYTFHGCPYAQRVHIALSELGVQFEEIEIDLDKPRDQWYLNINPRGLVPSLRISSPALGGEHILIESHIIVQFLADVVPGVLAPASNTPHGAFGRARINFFIDTWNTKVGALMFNMFRAQSPTEKEKLSGEWIRAVRKEIEPLLGDAKPFFGGSQRLTLAEINIAPFLLRIYALSDAGILPASLCEGLNTLPNFSRWTETVIKVDNVLADWNAERFLERTKARLERLKQVNQPQQAQQPKAAA